MMCGLLGSAFILGARDRPLDTVAIAAQSVRLRRRAPGCARFTQMLSRTLFHHISIFSHDSFNSHQSMDHTDRGPRASLHKNAEEGPY